MSSTNNSPLRVGIVGGGPAGLICAINLAEWAINTGKKDSYQITVRDTRYKETAGNGLVYGGSRSADPRNPGRRSQVVTLQCDCLDYLSEATKAMLFKNINEAVWSFTSRNIAIREVEDRLIERALMSEFCGIITLMPAEADDETRAQNLIRDCDFIVGADGSKSWVRERFLHVAEEDLQSEGVDDALGIAFKIPDGVFENGLPFPQALNDVFTVFQRRFLLNASAVENTGFLNMQLSANEFKQAVRNDGSACTFGRSPGFVRKPDGLLPEGVPEEWAFKPQQDYLNKTEGQQESARLWESIRSGLQLLGIPEEYVTTIIGVRLNVRFSPRVVNEINPGQIACLCGDAAFQTHFWPGRGMNSVMKESAMLAYSIFAAKQSLDARTFPRLSTATTEISAFEGFLNRLRNREHRDRSVRFLCNRRGRVDMRDRMTELIDNMNAQPLVQHAGLRSHPLSQKVAASTLAQEKAELVDKAKRWRNRLEKVVPGMAELSEEQMLRILSPILDNATVFELMLWNTSDSWPQAGGDEVLPGAEMRAIAENRGLPRPTDAPPATAADAGLPTLKTARGLENQTQAAKAGA